MNNIARIINRTQNKKETEAIVYSNYKMSLNQWIEEEIKLYKPTNRQSVFYGLDETGINSLLRLCECDNSEYRHFFFSGADHECFLKTRKDESVYSDITGKWLVAVEPDIYRKYMNNKQSYLLNNSCTLLSKQSAKKITSEILGLFKPFFIGSRLQSFPLTKIDQYIFYLFGKTRSAAGFRQLESELNMHMAYEFESLLETCKALKVYCFGIETGIDNDTDLLMGSLLEGDKKSFTGLQPLLKPTDSDDKKMAEKKRFLLAVFLFWANNSSADSSLLAFILNEIDSKHSLCFSKSPDDVARSRHLAATDRIYSSSQAGLNLFIHYANFLSGMGNYSWSQKNFKLTSYEWNEMSDKSPEGLIDETIDKLNKGYELPDPLGKILTKHIPIEMKTLRMILIEPELNKNFSVLSFSPEESALIAKALLREKAVEFWPMDNYPINKIINWIENSDIYLHYSCWFSPHELLSVKDKICSYSKNSHSVKPELFEVKLVGKTMDARLLELILTTRASGKHYSLYNEPDKNPVIYVRQIIRTDLEEILFYSEYNITEKK